MASRLLAGRLTAAVRTGNPARRFKAATYRENVRGCGRSVAERGPQESARRVTRRRGVDRSRRGLVRRGTRRVGPSAQAGGGPRPRHPHGDFFRPPLAMGEQSGVKSLRGQAPVASGGASLEIAVPGPVNRATDTAGPEATEATHKALPDRF